MCKPSRWLRLPPYAAILAMAIGSGASVVMGAPGPCADPLLSGFLDPPQSARPQVWWHWMNGNVSLEGARLDLAWMQRVGIGGVHIFAGSLFEPHVVEPPVNFMSEGWQAIFRDATLMARQQGMDVTIAGSPGWSETGGIWVAPENGMKKYVWSEIQVEGGGSSMAAFLSRPLRRDPSWVSRRSGGERRRRS